MVRTRRVSSFAMELASSTTAIQLIGHHQRTRDRGPHHRQARLRQGASVLAWACGAVRRARRGGRCGRTAPQVAVSGTAWRGGYTAAENLKQAAGLRAYAQGSIGTTVVPG